MKVEGKKRLNFLRGFDPISCLLPHVSLFLMTFQVKSHLRRSLAESLIVVVVVAYSAIEKPRLVKGRKS